MGILKSPPSDQIDALRTPLTAGEREVLELFESELADSWEIYLQPHLNGYQPDFVLLDEERGIAVFEVKDWNPRAYSLKSPRRTGGQYSLEPVNGGYAENPASKIRLYRKEIVELYCPRLDHNYGKNCISAGLILPRFTQDDIGKLIEPLFPSPRPPGNETISGIEELNARAIKTIFPKSMDDPDGQMNSELADDLRSWLIEPDSSAEQREPIELDNVQRRWAETRTRSGFRRIRGPAGSGKSQVLAWRASHLAQEEKRVLVVTYNIVILHFLRDMAVRAPGAHPNKVTWLNFHELCKRYSHQLGITEYKKVWQNYHQDEDGPHGDRDYLLREKIPQLVLSELEENPDILSDQDKFDAILVDEGQDFTPLWWQVLRKFCRNGGEMVLVADMTQDVYETAANWTDQAMTGAGFSGGWIELNISYRLPRSVARLAREFLETFNLDKGSLLPVAEDEQAELDLYPCTLRWVQVGGVDHASVCVDEMISLIADDDDNTRAFTDTTLITTSKKMGKKAVELLNQRNIRCTHTFADEKVGEKARRMKRAFWKGAPKVKVTTVQSFKGWEARNLVVFIGRAVQETDLKIFYTGLTRVKRHQEGSFITVVCAEHKLEEFGKKWDDFVRRP